MEQLDHLTTGDLRDLTRSLAERPRATGSDTPADVRTSPLDFVCEQALQVLENSRVAAFVYEISTAFCVVAANGCFASLSGFALESLIGSPLFNLLSHPNRPGVRQLLTSARPAGFTHSTGWRYRTRLGEIREVEVSGYDLDYRGAKARFVIVQDVTLRKREQLMRERLASIVENSHDAIVSTTVDGTVLSWNHAAEMLFGYSAGDMVGRSLRSLISPDVSIEEQAWYRLPMLSGEAIDNLETALLDRDGVSIAVSISVAPLRDGNGVIVGNSSIIRDIRAHRQSQQELAQINQRLRALASLSYDWTWEQDENLRFTYHSGEWLHRRHAFADTVIGHTRFELPIRWLSPADRDEHARVLNERKPFKDLEYRIADEDGHLHDMAIGGEPIFGADGRFTGYRGIGRDISEARKREQRLGLLSAIVGSSDDAITSWSPDGTLLSWNPGAQAMLGYSAAEVLGKSVSLLMPSTHGDWEQISARAAAGEKVVNQHSVHRHRNGTMISVAMTCSPMRDHAGQVLAVSCVARDIRSEKLHEHLVSQSHQRLKLALESAELSLWDWDIPAARMHYDEAFSKMLGFHPGEIADAHRPWENLLHPEDAPLVEQRLAAQLAQSRGFCELEFRLRTRSGEWLWVGARGRVVSRDRTEGAVRMMGTCQAITDRKRAEQMSRMLEAVLESSDDSIVSCTFDGTILSWNRGAERVFGYSSAEMIGRNRGQLIFEADRAAVERIDMRVRGGATVANIETVRRHQNGSAMNIALTAAPLRDADGHIIGVAAIARDITERMRAESARTLLAAVVESSQDAIISHALDGTILSWNRGAEEMFGYTASEAIDHDYRDLICVEPPEALHVRVARIERGERISTYETVGRRKDGGFVLISASAAALRDTDGRVHGVAVVARDIAAQKRLELLMARTESIGRVGGWEFDVRSQHLFWTDETFRIHEVTPQQFVPTWGNVLAFYAPESRSVLDQALLDAIAIGKPFDLELPLITRAGRHIWVRQIGEAQREGASVTNVYGTLQDITEKRQSEDALRRSERQLDAILDNVAEGIIVLSNTGEVQRLNRHAQSLFGYGESDIAGLTLAQLTVELGDERTDPDGVWLRRMLYTRRELTGRRKDGARFPLELALSEIEMSPEPSKLTAIVRDITQRKSWEDRIYNLAYSDSLTGLPNRLLLRDRLEHAIAAAQRNRSLVGVLFFDLDHFKTINDSYGHHAGDQLLRDISERSKRCVREIDTV
ncbi:MAG: PAS domain S-box protein, partial [Betaproteobacteria bacterium]